MPWRARIHRETDWQGAGGSDAIEVPPIASAHVAEMDRGTVVPAARWSIEMRTAAHPVPCEEKQAERGAKLFESRRNAADPSSRAGKVKPPRNGNAAVRGRTAS